MARWQNWSGKQASNLKSLCFLRSEDDGVAMIRDCNNRGRTVRVAGAGHSHSPVAINDQVMLDISGLSGILSVDRENGQAWIRAGSPIYSLGLPLHEHGLALKNQGDIDRQLLGGAIGTGTHGTGRQLQNISAAVTGLRLVIANGDIIECSDSLEPDLFAAARVGIGSVGMISAVNMQLRPSTILKEHSWQAQFEEFSNDIPGLVNAHERFEFFWYPGNDTATIKTIDSTEAAPVYPLAEEGSRQAWSHEVLPSHRPHLHTEMEYSVPFEVGLACFNEIRQLLRTDFPQISWPVEYRTVAADDIWLSMAFGRPTVTISVHQDIREPEEPYFRACEAIFLEYGGRPHWGKVNYLNGETFAALYPKWQDWWRVRDDVDPRGTFLNSWARSLRN